MKPWMTTGLAVLGLVALSAGSAQAQCAGPSCCPPCGSPPKCFFCCDFCCCAPLCCGNKCTDMVRDCCCRMNQCCDKVRACCTPCVDVYKPCLTFPKLRIPVFCPCVSCYCEPGAPRCGMAPWYEQFPCQAAGYGVGPYGAFSGPVALGPYASYGQPAATGPGYFGPPGYAAYGPAPSYWYGR
jgi:hypothetical protein